MSDTVAPLAFHPPVAPGEPARVSGVRNARYGEVLLVRAGDAGLVAEVWNTLGLNDCPGGPWSDLDPEVIARDAGALGASLNGPRHWLMDEIVNTEPAERQFARFGSLDFFLAATLLLGDRPPVRQPYETLTVARPTIFTWVAGRTIYELCDADRRRFVMQSYSLELMPDLTEARVGEIGDSLALPEGWTWRASVLAEPLQVHCPNGLATIVQDDRQHTYQLVEA